MSNKQLHHLQQICKANAKAVQRQDGAWLMKLPKSVPDNCCLVNCVSLPCGSHALKVEIN